MLDTTLLPLLAVLQLGADSTASLPSAPPSSPRSQPFPLPSVGRTLASLFQPNLGQFAPHVEFAAVGGSGRIEIGGSILRIVAGAGQEAPELAIRFGAPGVVTRPHGSEPAACRVNYLLGSDPAHWRVDVPTYRRVTCSEVAPGIGVESFVVGGALEYDVLLAPGSDLASLRLECLNATSLQVEPDGSLAIDTPGGSFRQRPPRAFRIGADGSRHEIPCAISIVSPNEFSFRLSGDSKGEIVIIDPVLEWSTLYGGNKSDGAAAAGIDNEGNVYLFGLTDSTVLPLTADAYDPTNNHQPGVNGSGPVDGFIAKLDPTGSELLYATYFGGQRYDEFRSAVVLPDGGVIAVGWTSSPDLPVTTGAYDTLLGLPFPQLDFDGFVMRIAPGGGQLVFSTFYGASNWDFLEDVAVDSNADICIGGLARSLDLPVTPNAPDKVLEDVDTNGGGDGCVARLDASGSSLLFSTYLGGKLSDAVGAVAIDEQGVAVAFGFSASTEFPVTSGAFDPAIQFPSTSDAFITRVDTHSGVILSSTFLGGISGDYARDVALVPGGDAVVVGGTTSLDFPVFGSYGWRCGPFCDRVFVTRITPDATTVVYSLLLGGSLTSLAHDVVALSDGSVVVGGETATPVFPTTPGAFANQLNQGFIHQGSDAFVTHVSADGRRLFYSTFFGGTEWDFGTGLAVTRDGSAILAGYTRPVAFPVTAGAFQTVPATPILAEAFAAKLSLLPKGVDRYGQPTSTDGGDPLRLYVTTMPIARSSDFAVRCIGAPVNAPGLLLVGPQALPDGLAAGGIELWVDPVQSKLVPVVADPFGAAEIVLPISADPSLLGMKGYLQFIFVDPCCSAGLTASGGLAIQVQP